MAGSEKIRCVKCGSANTVRSQWRNHQEKHGNPGMRPTRCRDCGHRFLADGEAPERRGPWLMVTVAAVAVAVTVAIGFLAGNPGPSEKAAESAPAISLSITPELMKAAEAGDPEAQFLVGSSMLGDSQLNLAYSTKAVDLLQQAADKGHGRAMLRLGLLFKQGVGAPQNYALAAKWIERAANTGEAEAMLEFGRLHREGIGVPKDLVKAYAWLNLSAAARDPVAARERGEVARQLSPGELQQAQMDSMSGNVRAARQAETPPAAAASPAPAQAPAVRQERP